MICDSPFYVHATKASLDKVPVPCGRCPLCKKRRVNQWVFRLMQEDKRSVSAYFVTLTYDTTHVPISDNGFMTLKKKDFQDYMKRLRKLCPSSTLKYYMSGEYGTNNFRPHYHAIIFNVPHKQLFADAWALGGSQYGGVHVGSVTSDSIAYCLKYIDKSNFRHAHGRDDRVAEFSLMSKGLGSNYLSSEVVNYHKSHIGMLYVTKLSGHKVAMPRYYRNKIFTESELSQQVSIVQNAVALSDEKRRIEYSRIFGGRVSVDLIFEREKFERYRKFYTSQKNRIL